MEKVLERIEAVAEKYIKEFEENPIKSGLKLLIFIWIFKKCYRFVKEA